MEISKEDIKSTYETISDDELIKIYSNGTLTDMARGVLEAELVSREIPIPDIARTKEKEEPTEQKGGVVKKVFFWIFAIMGFIVIKSFVDVLHHPNRQDSAVKSAMRQISDNNNEAFTLENTAPPSEINQVITNVVLQMKTIILNGGTPESIEEKIKQAKEMSATGMQLDHYSNNKMGWSAMDSKGRTVYSIIVDFGTKSKTAAKYLD